MLHSGSNILDIISDLDNRLSTWTVIGTESWLFRLVCGLQLLYYHKDGVSVGISVCIIIVFGKPVASK